MISQMSLLFISLAPVLAFVAGALVINLVTGLRKLPLFSRHSANLCCRNGL